MAMNTPNRTSATTIAPAGMARPSTNLRIAADRWAAASLAPSEGRAPTGSVSGGAPMLTPTPIPTSVRLSDDAFDQVIHLLESDVGLLLLGPGRDHDLPGVVQDRALVDDHAAGHELGL